MRKNPVAFADEVQRLMAQLPEDRIGWSIRLLLGTGMRTQELLALEPKHIAEDGSVIQIRQAINMVKGTPVVGTPKSRDSYRDVPIPPSLRRCAMQLREQGGTYIWESPRKPGYPLQPQPFPGQVPGGTGGDPRRAAADAPQLPPYLCIPDAGRGR